MDDAVVRTYLAALAQVAQSADAREESFYPALKTFVEQVAAQAVQVISQPRRTEAGNPDFRVWDGRSRIVGYIEAKRPDEELLDRVEQSEQLQRYRRTFPNLILTNFLEFRLYRNGERFDSVLLGRPVLLHRGRMAPPAENVDALFTLLYHFLSYRLPAPTSAESLALELAKRTRFLRDIVLQQIGEEKHEAGALIGVYDAFRTYLIGDLNEEEFADLYAQTVTYGLFAARTRAGNGFTRRNAFDAMPSTIGVLRDLFRYISLGDLPAQLEWIVDDIAHLLAEADTHGILARYYQQGKGSDPVVHFYETFLAHYDPDEREQRGVYYTPEPVVRYIVRSLHALLKEKELFALSDGLASPEVTLLDPAAGTMTFVAQAAAQAIHEFEDKYGSASRREFIREHILKHFFAFELMVAPYAIGHLKMGFLLEEMGYSLAQDERIPFYLTNTLDMSELEESRLPGLASLARESHLALQVKQQQPILVLLGNPPYSGHSANQGAWIRERIEDYKQVDGQPLGEKNPKWLQDDYVKFLRFAQWKVEQAGKGLVGMITNHSYLDNPTFRGMRQHLMQTFDRIYVLNLHGNSLKREVCPDGSKDENVFDIRQGVAIALMVKTGKPRQDATRVFYADLWGVRARKNEWLSQHDVTNTPWQPLQPETPLYLFAPRDQTLEAEYRNYPSVPELFPVHSVGIVTARDHLTIRWTEEEVWTTVRTFSTIEPELAREAFQLGKDADDWKVSLAQEDLRLSGPDRRHIVPVLYRPFDVRYTYYTGRSRGFICRPRPEVMRHMLAGENLALITHKREELDVAWSHALVTNLMTEHGVTSSKTTSYHFPLYLYPDGEQSVQQAMFTPRSSGTRQPNLNPDILARLVEWYGVAPSPEEVFACVYAILHAPSYRQRYAPFLRLDFPRIPFPHRPKAFRVMASLGQRLIDLHLLRSRLLEHPRARFEGDGEGVVARGKQGVRYDAPTQRLYINGNQYFAPVAQEVWQMRIGGYQVCDKWLKERTERKLSLDEVRTFCRVITALYHTVRFQRRIDAVFVRECVPSPL